MTHTYRPGDKARRLSPTPPFTSPPNALEVGGVYTVKRQDGNRLYLKKRTMSYSADQFEPVVEEGPLASFAPAPAADPVNAPAHYRRGGLEAIDVMEAFDLHRDGRLFNAAKYVLRAGRKDRESQDVRKAVWYLERYAADLESRGL